MNALTDYIYLTDKKHFINIKKKTPVSEAFMMQILAKSDPKFQDSMAAAKCIAAMKEVGTTQSALSNKASTEDLYEEVRHLLPFYFMTATNSRRNVYFLNEQNEATLLLDAKPADLVSSLLSSKPIYQSILEVYKNSEILGRQTIKMELQTYLEKITQRVLLDQEKFLDEEPKLLSWEPGDIAFKKFDPEQLQEGSYDTWKQFLDRLDFPQVFMAWVWSVFDPENEGRQLLWIKGNGNDGKSRVISALMDIYGKEYTAALVQGDVGSNFFFSKIYGKRFTVYDDCKQTNLITYEKIHTILGKGEAAIEYKSQNVFTGNVYSKIIVGSNMYPEVSFFKNNEKTRLICLTVKTFKDGSTSDNRFKEKLVEEKYAFLHACKKCYEVLCQDGSYITLPDELQEKIRRHCSSQKSLDITGFAEEKLVFDSKRYVESRELKKNLNEYLAEVGSVYKAKEHSHAFNDLRQYFLDKKLDETIMKVGGRQAHVFKGVGMKGDDSCILDQN